MKNLLNLIILLILFGCANNKPKIDNPNEFLDLFKPIKISLNKIESDETQGKLINKKYSLLILGDSTENVYACYKFDISPDFLGLVIRKMSMYTESEKELLIWNKLENNIDNRIILAEAWGDAGYGIERKSWLKYIKDLNQIELITNVEQYIPDNLPGESDTTKGINIDSTIIYHINKNMIDKLAIMISMDSIYYDTAYTNIYEKRILLDTIVYDGSKKSKYKFKNYK